MIIIIIIIYTSPIVRFCVFVNALYERNVTKTNSDVHLNVIGKSISLCPCILVLSLLLLLLLSCYVLISVLECHRVPCKLSPPFFICRVHSAVPS